MSAGQLTLRAAVTGMALGGVLCLSNLYVVLKTGWSLGVTITATIVAFGLFRALSAARLARPLGPLENVMVASIASSGAWMTGGGNMAALPALLLVTGQRPDGVAMVAWFALIASLGVVVAIPLRERFITQERLPFPMSVATAESIRAMHGGGDLTPARRLAVAGLVAALFTVWRDARLAWSLPSRLTSAALAPWGLGVDVSVVLLGGGSLMRPRTAWSMALGAALTWLVGVPLLVGAGRVTGPLEFKALVQLTLWPAAALLTSSALTSFGLLTARVLRRAHGAVMLPSPRVVVAFVALAAPLVGLMQWLFGIPVWMGVASLPLAVLVGVIGARVTGETDITPTKAMGPLTQLVFGVALPANVTANVMGANVTAGVGLHAADLLSDLKTGEALGADVRAQTISQFFGIVVGAVAVVPAFFALVPDASVLGSEALPAPAVMVWVGVSKALAGGAASLPDGASLSMTLAGVLGVVLTVLEAGLGERARWLPSASALGISMVLPFATTATMVMGAALGAWARRRWPDEVTLPVASGLIAGESVTGVLVALGRLALG